MWNRHGFAGLLLTFLLTPKAMGAPKSVDFDKTWKAFSSDYAKLNELNENFTQEITPHVQTFHRYRIWMEATTERLTQSASNDLMLQTAFHEYRNLLKNDTTCSSATVQTLSADLNMQLKRLKANLSALKEIEKQTKARELKAQMTKSVLEAENAASKAEKIILSYAETLESSDICLTLTHYDLILVAAETVNATRQSKSPLNLDEFLRNDRAQKDENQIKMESLRYLEAIEQAFVSNLTKGEIIKSLMLLYRLDGNMAFGTSKAKSLTLADKTEIDNAKKVLKLKIKAIAETSAFPKFEGLIAMTRSKARQTQDLLIERENNTLGPEEKNVFARIKEYCRTELQMEAKDGYLPPNLKTLEETLDYEEKLTLAYSQLKALR